MVCEKVCKNKVVRNRITEYSRKELHDRKKKESTACIYYVI